MTLKTSPDSKTAPSFIPPSSTPPQIGSLTVTDVISPATFDLGQKTSDDAMQDLQRQQARHAPVPTLSPARVSTSDTEVEPQLPYEILFFKKLEQVLQEHPNDAPAVEAWIKEQESKPTYKQPFYLLKKMLLFSSMLPADDKELRPGMASCQKLYKSCCDRLTALGLQKYINEGPSETYRKNILQQKNNLPVFLFNALCILKSLSAELKKLNLVPAAAETNRKAMTAWIARFKASVGYFPLFVACDHVSDLVSMFEGVADREQVVEFNEFYPFCRDQLEALGLKASLDEAPSMAAAAPPKALSDPERFKEELVFFREMIQQEDQALAKWLEENSHKSDYPLLWAKKRWPQRSRFSDTVNAKTRRDWSTCAEACFEKIQGTALQSYADITQIPADSSPELRKFLKGAD